jgi:hypothetical protein
MEEVKTTTRTIPKKYPIDGKSEGKKREVELRRVTCIVYFPVLALLLPRLSI